MANSSLINKIIALSPHIELAVRYLYWHNIKLLRSFSPRLKAKAKPKQTCDISKIIKFLDDSGVKAGSLTVVHSAFSALRGTNQSPQEIIEALTKLLGVSGTLAMPAIRSYPGEPSELDYLTKDLSKLECAYDPRNSKVATGVLPATMVKMPQAEISLFPLNSMVAIGPLAKPMMANNLIGDLPTACGPNSSWKFCVDHDAFIVGLGTDLVGCLTLLHVAEDVQDGKWPVRDWYRQRIFKIIDHGSETRIVVNERRPKWGALHWAGRNLCKDLVKAGLLISGNIDGVLVEILKAKELIDFLNQRNHDGYPYYWVKNCLQHQEAPKS